MYISLWTILLISTVVMDRASSQYNAYPVHRQDEIWTQWYNTDTPANFGGDDETLQSIRKRGWEVCPGYNIIAAQCRKVGSRNMFSEGTVHQYPDVDSLYRPCTSTGLYCRNADQTADQMCSNYEVRFQCKSGAVTDEAVYTWVAVLAVVFLVIPIAWVILINVKRKYCPGPARTQNSANATRTSVSTVSDPSVAEPPPSYDALFGGGSPLGSNSFEYGSTQALLENEIQRTSTNLTGHSRTAGRDNQNFILVSPSQSSTSGLSVSQSNVSINGISSQSNSNFPQVHRTNIHHHRGMHLPAFSFMRQISDGLPTPPPTYDDAIVKLGVPLPPKKDSS